MAVVVVRQAAGGTPSTVSRVLAAAGLATRTVLLAAGDDPRPDLSRVEGLIILGGPRSHTRHPALVREALAAEVPVLALGGGAGLPAHGADAGTHSGTHAHADAPAAADATPSEGPAVELTAAASTDPVFVEVPRPSARLRPAAGPLPLPADAVVLASCDGHPEQAFRIGASAWGVRFLAQDGLRQDDGDAPAAGEPPAGPILGRWGEELLGRFAALVTARAEHTATRAFFTRRAEAWQERFAHQIPAYEAAVARMRPAPGGLALDLAAGPAGPCRRCGPWWDPRAGSSASTSRPPCRARRPPRPPLDPGDLLAEPNLRPALETTGWRPAAYEDAATHFLARATRST